MPLTESPSTKKADPNPPAGETPTASGPSQSPGVPTERAGRRPGLARFHEVLGRCSLPPRSGLLLVLLIVSVLALILSARPIGPDDFNLQAAAPSPKLNIMGVKAPAAPRPEPQHLDMGAEALRDSLPLSAPAQAPGLIVPVQNQAAPTLDAEPESLAAFAGTRENGYATRTWQLGDTPMTRTWKMLTVQALIASALAASPAPAADSDNPAKPLDAAAINKRLDEIQRSIASLEKVRDTLTSLDAWVQKDLPDMKNELKKQIEGAAQTSDLRFSAMKGEIDALRKQVVQLQSDLDGLKVRTSASTQISQYQPPAQAPARGRVRLVNTYLEPITVLVNRDAYRLNPGESREVDSIPAGSFTYEILNIQPPRVRPLAAGETFTITVHPL